MRAYRFATDGMYQDICIVGGTLIECYHRARAELAIDGLRGIMLIDDDGRTICASLYGDDSTNGAWSASGRRVI